MASAIPPLEGVPELEEEATSLLLGSSVRRNVYFICCASLESVGNS